MPSFLEGFAPAERLKGIEVSDIVKIKLRADELKREGRDVIDLSIGEPDFDTPVHISVAAKAAMDRGETHYTPSAGTLALRSAIVRKVARDNGREVAINQVVVGVGAKQIIANAFLATLNPGDEVIIPTPYWSNYADMVRVAGGTPVFVVCDTASRFLMSADQLAAAIGPKTKWLMLNSPSNPTGSRYTRDELTALAGVLEQHPHVGILEDAIYEHIQFDDEPYCSIVDVAPDFAGRTLWVNGVSKAYAMTGWRIGYGVGPKPLIDAMTVVVAQTTSQPCSIAQAAAVEALDGDQAPVEAFRAIFEQRRDIVCAGLGAIQGLKVVRPGGAFYVFADISELLDCKRIEPAFSDDRALVAHLLEAANVAVVPGSSFGAPGYFRLSFAASDAALREAGARITSALS